MAKPNQHQENDKNSNKQSPVAVVMVPCPAQSHLNQLLRLSCIISSYNIPVHFVTSDIHNRQVKSRFQGFNFNFTKIHFHGFPIPSFPSPPPNFDPLTKFPLHGMPFFYAFTQLQQPVSDLLNSLSPTAERLVVVHDVLMASVVQDFSSIANSEAYAFHSSSALSLSRICDALGLGKDTQLGDGILPSKLPSFVSCVPTELAIFMASQMNLVKSQDSGVLHNTSRLIEGKLLDLLAKEDGQKKLWAVGPLHEVTSFKPRERNGGDKCLDWLESQEENSVLFISFGTTSTLSSQQIEELAIGLEQSEAKFIWVLRDADKGDVFKEDQEKSYQFLPLGFEERVKEKGMVVRDWVPQVGILGHPSTGGFMTHCGWNSCMESITMGVPLATWPITVDQPWNGVLLAEVLKVGLSVWKWERRDELVTSSMIKEAVKRLMGSKEGEEMRKRCEELGGDVRKSIGEGGVTRNEWDSFVAHITR
ncbi:hypothetical protein UlMin_006043 [Ulmus minor]